MTAAPMVGSTFFGLDISQFATRLLSIRRKISKRVLVLEFRPDSLLLAEATLTQLGVQLSHITSIPLPPEALDRGVPAEPLKMAGLIQDFCSENKIPAHRAAVVLPPELAFQRLLDLPAFLTTDEAREYVLNPANGLQIPFPLTQTDFDLFPVLTPVEQQDGDKRLYMLTAIPGVLVDPIVEMLQAADLELQLLELGSHSQLRNHAADLMSLSPQQVDLVLELLPDCSNLMLVSCSGLLGSERLASIRNPPELALEADQRAVALSSGVLAEDLLFKNESYLPLSDLDLRVLVADLRASLERFHLKRPGAEIRRVVLTGVNSSHPLLADLLVETLNLPVVLSRSIAVTGLAGLAMDDLLLQSALGRLSGLSLGLLPKDQLLACSLEGHALDAKKSQHQHDAVAIADLLSSSEAQTGLDLVAVETSAVGVVTEENNTDQSIYATNTTIQEVSALESDFELKPNATVDVANLLDPSPVSEKLSTNHDGLSSGLPMEVSVNEETSEIVFVQKPRDASSQDEWPSVAASDTEHQSDVEVLEDAETLEEQWPSITTLPDGNDSPSFMESDVLDDFSVETASSSLDPRISEDGFGSETLWPSISSAESIDDPFVEEVVVTDDDSESPVVSADTSQESMASFVPSVESEPSLQTNEDSSKATDVDLALPLNNPLRKPDVLEQSNSEESVSVKLSTESTSDVSSQYAIPDLQLMPENEEIREEQGSEHSESGQPDLIDASHELGELRFLEEN